MIEYVRLELLLEFAFDAAVEEIPPIAALLIGTLLRIVATMENLRMVRWVTDQLLFAVRIRLSLLFIKRTQKGLYLLLFVPFKNALDAHSFFFF